MKQLLLTALLFFSLSAEAVDFSTCSGDDTQALRAAVNANATVNLTCVASLSGRVVITGTGKKLTATGGGGIKQVGEAPILLLVSKCNACEVRGLTIDQGGYASNSIQVQDNIAPKIIANYFSGGNGGTAYVFAIRNQRGEYSDNTIVGSKGQQRGLWIGNGGTALAPDIEQGPVIENNTITGTDATGIGCMGINSVIRRNHVSDTKGAGVAIASNSTYAISTNVLVEGNVLLRNAFHGIQCDAWNGSRCSGGTIRRNITSGNGHSGIYVAHVQNWVITDNAGGGNPNGDIVLFDAHGILIDNLGMTVVDQGNYVGGANSEIRNLR